jgi:flagella basal body P-ring formation protein FlgA
MTVNQNSKKFLGMLALALWLLFPFNAIAASLVIQPNASVSSSVVRVGDVAAVAGLPSDIESEKLRAIIICSAPPPAETHIIRAGDIVSALAHSRVQPAGLEIAGAGEVIVSRDFEWLQTEELTEAFRVHVTERTGWAPESFMVRPPANLAPIPVPVGERSVQVSVAPNDQFTGSVLAQCEVLINDEPYRKLSHRFHVERYVETLVCSNKLRRGQPAEQGEFALAKVERSRLRGEPIVDIAQLRGKTVSRVINPGTPVSSDYFVTPPVIKRGETASIIWDGAGFIVVMQGKVLDDGRPGETVRVRLTSKKIVRADVMESGTLQVSE